MPEQISINNFISEVERGAITEVFSVTINTEKRVYGKSSSYPMEGNKTFKIVYAVVP